jgi:hypothetical protein
MQMPVVDNPFRKASHGIPEAHGATGKKSDKEKGRAEDPHPTQ